jgi:hypothetical protein
MHLMPAFRVERRLRAKLLLYLYQLSSIGVVGTEANTGFMDVRRSWQPLHAC